MKGTIVTAAVVSLASACVSFAAGTNSQNAVQVVRALKRAGMPITRYVNYTAASDPNHLLARPGQYVSKVNFRDARLRPVRGFDTEGGGSVETFRTRTDAQNRYRYVHAITSSSSLFAEYEYLQGTVFHRLSKVLTPRQAGAYKRALLKVVH
jgi:hypothetical protein